MHYSRQRVTTIMAFLEEHKGDFKKRWKIVNELTYSKQRCSTVPSKLINKDGIVITNDQTIADEFCFVKFC